MHSGWLVVVQAAILRLPAQRQRGPRQTPPATTQTNTYVGTQSPGWYTIAIDHTANTFSYQNLSANTAAVSGTFTTTANGFLVLSTTAGAAGYALEQLSRTVVLMPATQTIAGGRIALTGNAIFAVEAPSCQVIPEKTKFSYVAPANAYYDALNVTEDSITSGLLYASTDSSGANWAFGGETQSIITLTTPPMVFPYTPTPDPSSATCAASAGAAVTQAAITEPNSLAGNFAIGPTGYFIEDRYASDQVSFIGAVQPTSPIDLTALNGATFLGINATAGETSNYVPGVYAPSLSSFTASTDSSGKSIKLVGGGVSFQRSDPGSRHQCGP